MDRLAIRKSPPNRPHFSISSFEATHAILCSPIENRRAERLAHLHERDSLRIKLFLCLIETVERSSVEQEAQPLKLPMRRECRRASRCRRVSSGRSGLRPLVTARVMRAWRFSASRSRSARFFSISPSIRAVFSFRNRAIRRCVSSGGRANGAAVTFSAVEVWYSGQRCRSIST